MTETEFREVERDRKGFDRLTPIDKAREALLSVCHLSPSLQKPVFEAIGLISAQTITAPAPLPNHAIALHDGFAVNAIETIGASAYTPAFAVSPPRWIETGEILNSPTDAVLPAHAVQDKAFPIEILAQASPGEGVRFEGDDVKTGTVIVAAGERIKPVHAALLHAFGFDSIAVRSPRVRLLIGSNLPMGDLTAQCIATFSKSLGASAEVVAVNMHDVASFSETLAQNDADLIGSIGGTGFGDNDHAAIAMQKAGSLLVHGLALRPGETGGCGLIAGTPHRHPIPVILAPGRLEAACAIWLTLIRPCLCAMMDAAEPKKAAPLPLARKITSNPGVADIVLLRRALFEGKIQWEPLASGDLPWHALANAEAWHLVPPESEGYPAGALLHAEEI